MVRRRTGLRPLRTKWANSASRPSLSMGTAIAYITPWRRGSPGQRTPQSLMATESYAERSLRSSAPRGPDSRVCGVISTRMEDNAVVGWITSRNRARRANGL
eukprot:7285140-Alexandrium_andersonii.AAC.1